VTTSDDAGSTTVPFVVSDVEKAVVEAVKKRAEEIMRAANAGEPPVAVLIPDLNDMISEGFYWRSAERKIAALLAADFKQTDRKWVGLTGLARGRCYKRIMRP
jgi:hypothetical protein